MICQKPGVCAHIDLKILLIKIMNFYFLEVDKNMSNKLMVIYLIVIMNAYFSSNCRSEVFFFLLLITSVLVVLKIWNTDFWRNICIINRLYMFFYLTTSYFLRYGGLDFLWFVQGSTTLSVQSRFFKKKYSSPMPYITCSNTVDRLSN